MPSTALTSSSVTMRAGEVSTSPVTATRPSAIIHSASRREHSPARAIALATRADPSGLAASPATVCGRAASDAGAHVLVFFFGAKERAFGMNDDEAIALAMEEAHAAALRSEVPVGAVLLSRDGELLAQSGNRIVELRDPTAHAEILTLRAGAAKTGNERLLGASLFVSLEPCAMCSGAISLARGSRVGFAADDPKGGAVLHGPKFSEQPTSHHRPIIERLGDPAVAGAMLKEFFRIRRS